MHVVSMPTGLFILLMLLAFIAGLIVSFASCRHAADQVYKQADREQGSRFTSNANKFLS